MTRLARYMARSLARYMARSQALILALLATTATADIRGFENDYPALLADHADSVRQPSPDTRVLERPGPVIVYEETAPDGTLRYRAEDQSGLGAPGCILNSLINATVISGLCPGTLDAHASAKLDAMTRAMARFVGANTYPPVPADQIDTRLVDEVRARAAQIKLRCPPPDSGAQDGAERLRAMLRFGGMQAMKRAMSMPRLPAMLPCD